MTSNSVDPQAVKRASERIILAAGGKICDWLPWLDRKSARGRDELVARALILHAFVNIYFKAPIEVIRDWLIEEGLESYLSARESAILEKSNEELSEQEEIDLYWRIEALWALLWAGSLIDALPFDRPVDDSMASYCPNLERGEDGSKFSQRMRVRPFDELFRMLDLYYRLHWYARDGRLNGYPTHPVSLDIIMERRRALEWILDPETDWDLLRDDT